MKNITSQNVETNNEKNSYIEQVEEYTGKSINLLNENEINHCLEYVDDDNKETFINTIKDLKYFNIKYIGQHPFDEQDRYNHNTYSIVIKRGNTIIKPSTFKTSSNDTDNDIRPSLYNILTCLASDGLLDTSSFENFCNELAYDEDSRKAEKLYKTIVKEQEKLFKIFTRDELYSFPQ